MVTAADQLIGEVKGDLEGAQRDADRTSLRQERRTAIDRLAISDDLSREKRRDLAEGDLANPKIIQAGLSSLRPEMKEAVAYYFDNLGHNEHLLDVEVELAEKIISNIYKNYSKKETLGRAIESIRSQINLTANFSSEARKKVTLDMILAEIAGSEDVSEDVYGKIENIDAIMASYGSSVNSEILNKILRDLVAQKKELDDYFESEGELTKKIFTSLIVQKVSASDSGMYRSKKDESSSVGEQEPAGFLSFVDYARDLRSEYVKARESGNVEIEKALAGMIPGLINSFEIKCASLLKRSGLIQLEGRQSEADFLEHLPDIKDYQETYFPKKKAVIEAETEDYKNREGHDYRINLGLLDLMIKMEETYRKYAEVGKSGAKEAADTLEQISERRQNSPEVRSLKERYKARVDSMAKKLGFDSLFIERLMETRYSHLPSLNVETEIPEDSSDFLEPPEIKG